MILNIRSASDPSNPHITCMYAPLTLYVGGHTHTVHTPSTHGRHTLTIDTQVIRTHIEHRHLVMSQWSFSTATVETMYGEALGGEMISELLQ